jgi:drug/metabolite transporter (DMT)-like permease
MTRRVWLLIIATAAVWGASYMFIKVALDDLSEGAIVCLRTAIGAVPLVILAQRTGQLGAVRPHFRWIAVITMIQVVAPFLLITYGEVHIASSLTAILVAVVPIFTALLALRFDHAERSRGWGLAGIVIGICGVVLLFGVDLSGSADELLGGGMIVLAALGYAAAWMLTKHKLAGAPAVGVTAVTMVIATVVTLPLLAAQPPTESPGIDTVAAMLALGAGGTGLAFVLYNKVIAAVGPARASVVAYLAPAFSVVYGASVLGESVTIGSLGGLALILAGSWLAAQGRLPAWLSRSEPSRSSEPAPVRVR